MSSGLMKVPFPIEALLIKLPNEFFSIWSIIITPPKTGRGTIHPSHLISVIT